MIPVLAVLKVIIRRIIHSSLGLTMIPIIVLIIIGTLGYSWLEGWSYFDALYATIITITTVGYGDLSPQTLPGRMFAIVFTIAAIGLAGFAISTLAAVVIEYETTRVQRAIQERRMKKLANLKDHMIICGGNFVASRVATEFYRRKTPFVIIEKSEETLKWALLWMHEGYVEKRRRHFDLLDDVDLVEEDKSVAELADEVGILYLLEDPTDEQQLRRAGIDRARGLVTALDDDRDNIAVVLSARHMANQLENPKLRIVGRVLDEWNMRRLYLAGADKVTAPNMVGGFHMASQMVSPDVGDFWEQMLFWNDHQLRFDDIRIAEQPNLAGKTVNDLRQDHGQLVVAIKRNETYYNAPDPDMAFEADDILIIMGQMITEG